MSAVDEAAALMQGFAERTGLLGDAPPSRYLWTDAFAVCNWLALSRKTGDPSHERRALALVDQVHHVLGRHRRDDPRRGWISGLSDAEGERHPTRGGLRIGKPLPERAPGEEFDEWLEWERDGQYFHYLTRWMHALDQVARRTGEARFNGWARELAATAHRAFTVGAPGRRRMVWKMSIDLSRALVASMGQHDPVDGLVTCLQLRATADRLAVAPKEPGLEVAVAEFAGLVAPAGLATADPLGLGGLLLDAGRIAQLAAQGALADGDLLEPLLAAALAGLEAFERSGSLARPVEGRLAFRELGLAIGIAALGPMTAALEGIGDREGRARLASRLEALRAFSDLEASILSFWRDPDHRETGSWNAQRDINDVMLATALVPDGLLVLEPLGARRP